MPEKILIVDDDVDSLKLIGLMLQRHGYEVSAANTGGQALTKASAEQPDLIILDVMMPDMDGLEVCRRLRAKSETREIPIIMFTAKTLIDDKVAGFEAGADDYLTKPTHPAELASRVKANLTRKASADAKNGKGGGVTIGVLGVKGGVGTTTVAINVASALVQAGDKAVLAEMRPGAGSAGLYLGINGERNLGQLLTTPAEQITPEMLEPLLARHDSGLRLLLASHNPNETSVTPKAESVLGLVKALRKVGSPVLFDLGNGLNPFVRALQREMDKLLLVTEPTGVAVTLAQELIANLENSGLSRARLSLVVVNRSQSTLQVGWQEIEQKLDQPLRAEISSAPDLAYQAAEAQLPIIIFQPNAMVASQLSKLAEDLKPKQVRPISR